MARERWATAAGFSAYEVSTLGRVRQRWTKRLISTWPNDKGYLYAMMQRAGAWLKVRVHRLVWQTFRGTIPPGHDVDHRDRQRANARLSNLRLLTFSQNRDGGEARSGVSRYRGVTWCKDRGLWQAQINYTKSNRFIGRYRSQIEAARAYDREARRLRGKFAITNFGR